MIYVRRKITVPVLRSLLLSAAELNARLFTLSRYPSATVRESQRLSARFQYFQVAQREVEPVTLYEGQPVEARPVLFRLDSASIEKLVSFLPRLERLCDSLAAYAPEQDGFVYCSIFHERMSIFRDLEGLEQILERRGILFSHATPEGW
jgi:hypothetical protein